MSKRTRTDRPHPPTARPARRAGQTKLTLVVPEAFARRFHGFAGWYGLELGQLVVELVTRHLDRRGFPATATAPPALPTADGDGIEEPNAATLPLRAVSETAA